MKKPIFTIIQTCFLIFMLGCWHTELQAQTPFTITWTGLTGATSATGVPAGITIVQQYNGVTAACATTANGATTSYSAIIKAAAGYNITITSIGGSAYASNAGSRDFKFQLTNGSVYTQASPTSIPSSSNCGGNTALTAYSIPATGQTVTSGNQATITVLRAPGTATGAGYSYTRTLTITGVVTAVCDDPTNLTGNSVTANAATLNWDAAGSNNFEYVLDQSASTPSGAGTAVSGTSYHASSLLPSTTYYFHLRQNCGSGFSNWVSTSFTTPAAPCTAPSGLTATNTTHNASDLFWNSQGNNGFEYVLNQTATDPTGSGIATNDTTYDATALTPSTTYYLHVRTNCGSGNFSPWTSISFTTLTAPCISPSGLTTANTTHNASDLSWNSQGNNGFEYVLNQTATDPTGSGIATNDTTYDATALTPSTTYYLHVRTNCGSGNYSPWTSISFTTLTAPCISPGGLTTANTTHNASDLSWNSQGINGFEYVLNQTTADPTGSGIATNDTTYDATALTPSTTYYLHVRTNCGSGNFSPWTSISFTTLTAPCISPGGLTTANTTHNASDLSWNSQGNNGFEYVLNQTATDPTGSGTATNDTTYDATALTPSTTYYLHVRTNCGNGNYSPWVSTSFTTLVEPCDAPTGLTNTNTTHDSSEIFWNTQAGSSFEYVFNQSPADPVTAGTPTSDTNYHATTLSPLTTYYLHLRADCGNGNYSQWITLSFTTLIEPCDAPTGLMDANTTFNSADLSWNAQGNNGFEYVVDQTNADPATAGTATTDTTYHATALDAETTYYLHVRTDCGNGNFSPWVTMPFTTLAEPCDAPNGLMDANTTFNSADLSWNTQGNNGFEYVVDQTNADPATAGTATTDTTYHATALDAETTYYLHVRTDCGNGNFSPWVTMPFTTLAEPCDAPNGLMDANTTSNSADLSWNTQGNNGFEYVVDQTNADPAAAGTATTDTTYHATALDAETTYYLHVRTDCGNGNFSPWVTVPFTTLAEPCDAPTGLDTSNVTAHGAHFNWTAQAGSSFEYILNQSAGTPGGNTTTTSNNTLTVSSLMEATTYYFHVRRDCGNGNFSDWTTISFTTPSTLGIQEQVTVNLGAYPNPAQNLVTITGQTHGTLVLSNLKGQRLMSVNLEETHTLDVSALESGIYFLAYSSDSKTALIKLIKQ